MAKREYSETEIAVALASLKANGYDYAKASKFTGIPGKQIEKWERGEPDIETILRSRPIPTKDLTDPLDTRLLFAPAPEIDAWVKTNIIGDGPLYNPDHDHLLDAFIGYLWTNVPNSKQMRRIVGTCEIPSAQGNRWLKSRVEAQLIDWFGAVPDFLITLDAQYAAECGDASWCALVEHELYHCSQAVDIDNEPRFNIDGLPIWAIRGHDVEEHIGVVRRYGSGASSPGVAEMVRVAQMAPEVAAAHIDAACGTCLSKR